MNTQQIKDLRVFTSTEITTHKTKADFCLFELKKMSRNGVYHENVDRLGGLFCLKSYEPTQDKNLVFTKVHPKIKRVVYFYCGIMFLRRNHIGALSVFFISLCAFATDMPVMFSDFGKTKNVSNHIKSINEGIKRCLERGQENSHFGRPPTKEESIDKRFCTIYHWMEQNENQYPWYDANIEVFDHNSFSEETFSNISKKQSTRISICNNKAVEAAVALHNQFPDAKIAINNYESPLIAEVGFLRGWNRPEDDLAKKTTLMTGLYAETTWTNFYQRICNNPDNYVELGLVYGTKVYVVFQGEQYIPVQKPFLIDVLTSTVQYWSDSDNNEILREKIKNAFRNIVKAAISRGDDIFILGDFGCEALEYNPREMAKIVYEVLVEEGWGKYFYLINFAMRQAEIRGAFNHQFDQTVII